MKKKNVNNQLTWNVPSSRCVIFVNDLLIHVNYTKYNIEKCCN